MFYVYLLQNVNNREDFYLGYSSDLKRRVNEHNSGKNQSTKGKSWLVVYYEAYTTMEAARYRERVLKHDGRVRRFLMDRIKKHI